MKKKLLSLLGAGLLAISSVFAQSNAYGLPAEIQDGNILHCFNWSINDVKDNLPKIAEAGFGAVQLSPLQRPSAQKSHVWSDLYRPYDFAFKASNALGNAEDLRALCIEASKYGIKVIVDVVANHVDKASGYHDQWWDASSDRVRSKGGNANINYGNRNSITHDRLGDYYEVNSENAEVIARAKAYVQDLHDMGVSGIRWDAAKHIGLPSEGCDFWAEVTSVPGMFHYGEILGTPGPNNNDALITEYAKYMSVTDSRYSDPIAESYGGVALNKNGQWAPIIGADKLIYWGETHDTYSNTPEYGGWSSSKSQAMIDRAYACVASREGAAALYLSRPLASGYGNIKIVKGSDNYQTPAVAEVNKFRNKMNGRAEFFSPGVDCMSVTRNNGGAVVVMKTSGSFSVPNGGGYCPTGTYTDRVSGNTITVTSSTISGTAGTSGIVVIYNDVLDDPKDLPEQGYGEDGMKVYWDNSVSNWPTVNLHYWGSDQTTWPGKEMTKVEDSNYADLWEITVPGGANGVFNNAGKGEQTVDVNNLLPNHIYRATTLKSGKYEVEVVGQYVPAGVDSVVSDTYNYTVSASNGALSINGLEGQFVVVASVSGRLLHNGNVTGDFELNVLPGIYILNIDGNHHKVLVP